MSPVLEVSAGSPHPLGANVAPGGVNFSLFSSSATAVELLLFHSFDADAPMQVIALDPRRNRTFSYWHAFVHGVGEGLVYAYRCDGPDDPERGLCFDADKLLLDPYARGIVYGPSVSRVDAISRGSNVATAMKSLVVDPSRFDWQGVEPPRIPAAERVIYELHVRGFTRHPSSQTRHPGSFQALVEKVPYLRELGVTTVELMPVFQFDPHSLPFRDPTTNTELTDYWGYNPLGFFAPHRGYYEEDWHRMRYLTGFRDMVREFHRAGIEVVLDVVFNHTGEGGVDGPTQCFRGIDNPVYYLLEREPGRAAKYLDYSGTGNTFNCNHPIARRMVLDALRYWAGTMRVDGFRFDLATILARDVHGRPMADPPLPWGDPAMPAALVDDSPEQVLASTFHRAHAPLWCARTDAAELTALQDRTRTAPAASKAALCQVCTEVVARHVRPDADGKSLCEVLSPGSPVLTGDGEPTRVAEARCGCADTFAVIADSGLRFVRADGTTGGLTEVGGPAPTGSLVRDAVAATRNRIFVTNGQGDLVGLRWDGTAMPSATELDLTPADATTTRFHLGGDPRGVAFVQSLGKDWLLVVDGASDLLRVYELGDENVERFELCSTVDVGRDATRIEGAWDLVTAADGSKGYVSFRGPLNTPGDAIAMFDLLPLFTCDGQNPMVSHVTTFGGGQGIGPMALSPDGELLAVGARLRTTCLDRVYTNTTGTQIDAQVGCDLVYVLRVDQLAAGPLAAGAIVNFGARNSFPTRPLSYPYAVAWRPDGSEVAYGSFLGLSPWPLYSDMGAQGGVALGTIGAPAFPSPQGQLHWSYNAPLGGSVAGETVEFTADGRFVIAAAMDGKVYSFPAAPTADFWQNREADPETIIHAGLILRSWYGGCRVAGTCPGGWCPRNCPTGAADVPTLTIGSPIRKLLRL